MLGKPTIRSVLLSVNLILLLLPLAGIGGFRLYETELIRRTEAELIAQTVLLKEIFLTEYHRLPIEAEAKESLLGNTVSQRLRDLHQIRTGQFRKIYPRLDIYRERKRDPIIDPELGAPIANDHWKAVGNELETVIKRAQFNLLSGIRVVNSEGQVIASTVGVTGHTLSDREEVRRALAGEPLSIIRRRAQQELPTHSLLSYGTGVIVFVAQPVVVENRVLGAIIASRTPMNLANAIFEHRHHLVRFFVILLILVLLATITTAGLIGGPIRRLAALTRYDRKAGQEFPMQPIKRPGTAEVAALSEAFAKMSNNLHERADYTEGLVRSVSHEFKTPIASIKASVEILEDHFDGMTTEERRKFLSMIGKDSHRLQRLVERLLELARADAIVSPAGTCCPNTVISEIKDDFQSLCRTISVVPCSSVQVSMPRDILHTCLSNIVGNSVSHGSQSVQIDISCRNASKHVTIVIKDDGPGIDPRDRAKIFEPFFTTARENGGTGLGLSIVKSLIDAYSGKIEVHSPVEKGRGTLVTLSLPIAATP